MRILIPISILLFILLSETGCTRKIYIPVERESVSVDTMQRTFIRYDSVVSRDSVILRQNGDTILKTVVRYRERYRSRHDTLIQIRHDSIYLEKPLPINNTSASSGTIYAKLRSIALLTLYSFLTILLIIFLYRRFKR